MLSLQLTLQEEQGAVQHQLLSSLTAALRHHYCQRHTFMRVLGNLCSPLLQDLSRADDQGRTAVDLHLAVGTHLCTGKADALACRAGA